MANRSRKSNAMKYVKDTTNVEQFIDKICPITNTNMRLKSRASRYAHDQLARTGKPVCTSRGILMPAKLDLTNYLKKKEEK